jgi:hypothetical protein
MEKVNQGNGLKRCVRRVCIRPRKPRIAVRVALLALFVGLAMGCSSAVSEFTEEQLAALNEFAGEAFGAEPYYLDQFRKGEFPENVIEIGVRAAHFEEQGLYLVFYGFQNEESGVLVPRPGVVLEEKLSENFSTEALGENLFWYHLKN